MINLRFTFVKIIVIQPSGCKGNFNKTIYLSIYNPDVPRSSRKL